MENKLSNKLINYGILTSLVFIAVILSYRYVVKKNLCESNEGYKYEWWSCENKNPEKEKSSRRVNLENRLRNMDTEPAQNSVEQENKNYKTDYLTIKYTSKDGEVELTTITSNTEALPISYQNYLIFLNNSDKLMLFDLTKVDPPFTIGALANQKGFEPNTLFCLPKQNTLSGKPRFLVFNSFGDLQTETSFPQGCTRTMPVLQDNQLLDYIAEKNTPMRTKTYLELIELPNSIILEMAE